MSEKLCTLRTQGGGGGAKQTETVLWTNSNPTSSSGWTPQTITLSGNKSDYDYIKFIFAYNYNNPTSTINVVYPVSELSKFNDYTRGVSCAYTSANGRFFYRVANNGNADNTIGLMNCYQQETNNTWSINNLMLIPLSIIGIKNMGGVRTNEKYDMLPFKSITGGTTPTFATKGLAKGCWIYFTSTSGTGVLTNVNPYTGEIETSKCWRCMGNTTTIEQYTNNYFVISNGTVALDQRYSSVTYNMALAYTY